MKRPAAAAVEPQEPKKIRFDKCKLRFTPIEHDINVSEMTRDQFMLSASRNRPNRPDGPSLRCLMREVQKALAIRESDALLQLKSKLECLSASRDLDEAALAEAESVAEGLGIQVRPFIVKEVTEKDYQDYLADVAEEKMLIRRLIRLA